MLSKKIKNFINKVKPHPPVLPAATQHEFISWLKFANAGMLQEGNIFAFEYAIKNLPSENPVIEIGSFCGLSTNLISFYLERENKNNRLITCDKWVFEGAEKSDQFLGGSTITHTSYKNFVRESFIKNVSFFSSGRMDKNSTIEEFSDDFFQIWGKNAVVEDVFHKEVKLGGNISFAYIDGNHTYEFAKRDFQNVDKFLDHGGLILFDDSFDGSDWEVCRVIDEIKAGTEYEIVMHNPNYLVRKIK